MSWKRFRQEVGRRFDLEELRTLCFDLGIDYDDLGGERKEAKVRELIAHLWRSDRLDLLLALLAERRPAVDWAGLRPVDPAQPPGRFQTRSVWLIIAAAVVIIVLTFATFSFLWPERWPGGARIGGSPPIATIDAFEADDCFRDLVAAELDRLAVVEVGTLPVRLLPSGRDRAGGVALIVTDLGEPAGFIKFFLGAEDTIRVENAFDARCRTMDQYENITTGRWQGALLPGDILRIGLGPQEYYLIFRFDEEGALFLDYLETS